MGIRRKPEPEDAPAPLKAVPPKEKEDEGKNCPAEQLTFGDPHNGEPCKCSLTAGHGGPHVCGGCSATFSTQL